MYLIVAGLVLLGAVCGAAIRLLPFMIVLVSAVAIAAVSPATHGDGSTWLAVVITPVVLQVGYALGIVCRAIFRSRRQRRPTSSADERVGLSTRQNPH